MRNVRILQYKIKYNIKLTLNPKGAGEPTIRGESVRKGQLFQP